MEDCARAMTPIRYSAMKIVRMLVPNCSADWCIHAGALVRFAYARKLDIDREFVEPVLSARIRDIYPLRERFAAQEKSLQFG